MQGKKGLAEDPRYAKIGLSKAEKARAEKGARKGAKPAEADESNNQTSKVKLIVAVVALTIGLGLITWYLLNQFGVIGTGIEQPGIPVETPPPIDHSAPPVRPGTPTSAPAGSS